MENTEVERKSRRINKQTRDKQDGGGGNLRGGTSIFGRFLCLRIARSNAFSISFAFSTDSSAVLKLTAPPTLQRVSAGNWLLSRGRGLLTDYIGCTELKYYNAVVEEARNKENPKQK